MVPRLLRGDETWCQGFSEPGTGSNLAALTCAAARVDDGWCVNGQKVWTSLAQYAQRCVLLTRTGGPDSAHRGITALFVDMDTPGHHRAPDRDDPRSRGVLRGVLRRRARARRSHARRRGPGLGGGDGPAALRAQHRARGTAAPTCTARSRSSLAGRRRRAPCARDEVGEAFQQLFALPRPLPRHPAPHGRRRHGSAPRPRSTRSSSPPPSRRSSTSPSTAWPTTCCSATTPAASSGARSTSTPGPPRSTAAAPRSSATSSPAASSTSDPTDDGRRGARALRQGHPARHRVVVRCRPRRRPRRARLAGRPRGRRRDDGRHACSSTRARRPPRRRRSTS